MSLKKYMLVDIIILGIIGCAVEVLGVYVFNLMLTAQAITTAISLLMMIVSTTRWGWKGLILAPFLALATILSGMLLNPHELYRANYNWQLYIATLFQLLSISVNLLWYKKVKDEEETFKKLSSIFGMCAIDCLVSLLVVTIIYYFCSFQFLFLGFIVWNSFGYILVFVGAFILSRQGILVNVKKNLLKRKQENEKELDFKLNISDDVEEENLEKERVNFKDGKDN